jgi:hypothetical protein
MARPCRLPPQVVPLHQIRLDPAACVQPLEAKVNRGSASTSASSLRGSKCTSYSSSTSAFAWAYATRLMKMEINLPLKRARKVGIGPEDYIDDGMTPTSPTSSPYSSRIVVVLWTRPRSGSSRRSYRERFLSTSTTTTDPRRAAELAMFNLFGLEQCCTPSEPIQSTRDMCVVLNKLPLSRVD